MKKNNDRKPAGRTFNKASARSKPFGKRTSDEASEKSGSVKKRPRRTTGGDDFKGDKKPYEKRESSFGDKPSDSYRSKKKSFGDKPDYKGDKKPYAKREGSFGDKPFKKPYAKREEGSSDDKPFRKKPYGNSDYKGDKKPYAKRESSGSGDRPYKKKPFGDSDYKGDKKPYAKRESSSFGDRPYKKKPYGEKPSYKDDKKPFKKTTGGGTYLAERTFGKKTYGDDAGEKKPYEKREAFTDRPVKKRFDKRAAIAATKKDDEGEWQVFEDANSADRFRKKHTRSFKEEGFAGEIRLNKYIANAGVCSRREADELISVGAVTVNGKVVTEMGYKVKTSDVIHYGGELLRREKEVYILLNKPKDYITTTDDPQERRTVMQLIADAGDARVVPVGRLDRQTTGLLLLTNDGEMVTRLTHPRYGIKKIYHVGLDKNLRPEDLKAIAEGIELEDGPIQVDEIAYVGDGGDRSEIGVELHSGRNRIVRRIFEHFEYQVTKLDRVYFAGLTKKDLPRGHWRFLSELEVNMLKMLGGGFSAGKKKKFVSGKSKKKKAEAED